MSTADQHQPQQTAEVAKTSKKRYADDDHPMEVRINSVLSSKHF